MRDGPIRVLIADDHLVVGQAIMLWLENQDDISVIGLVGSGRQALEVTLESCPDVLILDIKMPEMDGLQVLSALSSAEHKPIVLILTSFTKPRFLSHAMALGAAGFLSKDMGLHRIGQAIRKAYEGKAVVDIGASRESFESISDQLQMVGETSEDVQFSDEELRLLTMIAEGKSNQEIAAELNLSSRSIRSKLTSLYEKIGVQHRMQAVVWALGRGMLPES